MATHTIGGRSAVRPLRLFLGAFLVLHGVAHLVGTASSLAAVDDGSSVSYLAGAWKVAGPNALRALAVAWAVVGVAVIASGIAVLIPLPSWRRIVAGAITVSLVLSVAALTAAVVGVVIDALVLLVLALGDRLGPLRGAPGGELR